MQLLLPLIILILILLLPSMSYSNESIEPVSNPPGPWTKPIRTPNGFKVWGREFIHGDSLLPTQIVSGKTNLLTRPISISYKPANGSLQAVDLKTVNTRTFKDGYISSGVYSDEYITVNAEMTLEYDGFQRFDLIIKPNQDSIIDKLEATAHLSNAYARSFSKFLEYDFSKQNVRPGSDLAASGPITEKSDFHFNPTIWIGSDNTGLEWIQETNIHFVSRNPQTTHSIERDTSETRLITRIIDHPTSLSAPLPYSFALLATPTKQRDQSLQGKVLTSRLPNKKQISTGICCENQVYIGHWKRTPLDKPGLPFPSSDPGELSRYNKHRESLRRADMPYIPYSALYILPADLSAFDENPSWKAAPARKGSAHWTKRLQLKKPIQPVSYLDQSLRDFILSSHQQALQQHAIDGIYFDVATMRELPSVTASMVEQHGQKSKAWNVYYPMYGHRELLKDYWAQMKELNPEFLIVHHGASIPKLSYPFIDIVVFGEPFHRHFANNISDEKYPDNPTYVPDYYALDPRFIPNAQQLLNGPAHALLPLVKRKNDDYLEKHPELYRRWSRAAVAVSFLNNLLLWNTRIETAAWESYWRAVQEFGGLTNAKHNRVKTNMPNLQAAMYENEKAQLLMISNQTMVDTTIQLDELYSFDGISPEKIKNIQFVESDNLPQTQAPDGIKIPAKNHVLLLLNFN